MRFCDVKVRPKVMVILGAIALFLQFGTIPAQAIPIEVNFTLEDFIPRYTSTPPPDDPVIGRIIYEAESITANIDSLTAIDLTIDGHTYSISEIGYISPFFSRQQMGGSLSGVNAISSGTDDFRLDWYKETLTPMKFSYTSSLHGGFWDSNTFSSFSVAESHSVPEPSNLLLLGSGLVALGFFFRRLKK